MGNEGVFEAGTYGGSFRLGSSGRLLLLLRGCTAQAGVVGLGIFESLLEEVGVYTDKSQCQSSESPISPDTTNIVKTTRNSTHFQSYRT